MDTETQQTVSPQSLTPLRFDVLRDTNMRRCETVFHKLDDWSPTDWSNALAGEVGELCNFLKKVRRGDTVSVKAIANELADIAIYLDLLAARLRVDLGAAIVEKFNEVSEARGSDIKLSARPEHRRPPLGVMPRWLWLERRLGELCATVWRHDASGIKWELAQEIHTIVEEMARLDVVGSESMRELINKAEKDTDMASVFVLGPSWDEAEACVVVVKGKGNARAMRELLIREKMLTPGKPVDPSSTDTAAGPK